MDFKVRDFASLTSDLTGPCAWIIIAEIWPLSARAKGTALGASASEFPAVWLKATEGSISSKIKSNHLSFLADWMNNFIVGQVTPDMLTGITYGTYIFFGLITFLGALFIAFLVPETKQLSLEEMDIIFGSEGTAVSDYERQTEISREIGLDDALARLANGTRTNISSADVMHEMKA